MYRKLTAWLLAVLLLLSAVSCGTATTPDPVPGTDGTPETTPATESESATETASETASETEPATEAATETEPAPEAATETEPAPEAATETDPAPEAATETEPAPEAATETEPATKAATETEPATEAATETEPATEAATETEPATEAATETEPKAEDMIQVDRKVPMDPSPDLGFDPDPAKAPKPDLDNLIRVTAAPYNAKGDGKSNDREAIQSAIDAAYKAGGGTVCLDAGKTFMTGNIILRSNVVLYFEDGAVLQQTFNPNVYVKPTADGGYEPIKPITGHDYKAVQWGHSWAYNYPFVYAGEGTENITITGKGTIRMHRGQSCDSTMHMCPIGMYRVNNFEVSEITICNYSSYAFQPNICTNGLIKHITIKDPADGNGDGISLINCQNIRVTQNYLMTSDDGIYVATNYNDPRKGTWCSAKEPIPSKNIEIDHNYCNLTNTACKGIAFILWGTSAPDLRNVEASNIYIHNNYAYSFGIWDDDPFDNLKGPTPIKQVVFTNNVIDNILTNFSIFQIHDLTGFNSAKSIANGNFERTGEAYWSTRTNANPNSAGGSNEKVGQDGKWFGFIDHLDEGDAAIYQGLFLMSNADYTFTAKLQSSGDPCRLFVRSMETGELVASQEFTNTDWETVTFAFTVPKQGNYHVGIERGNATKGWARIDSVEMTAGSNRNSDNTIFSSQIPDSYSDGGGYRNELGTLFAATVNGKVTKVLMYATTEESGIHYVSIWDYRTKRLVSAECYEWDIPAGSDGWLEFELPEPVSIKANTKYVVSVSAGPDCHFVRGTDQLKKPITSKYLKTYLSSGLYSNNEVQVMPTQTTSTNYFRDVYFVPDEAAD